MRILLKLFIAVTPLLFTVLFAWLVMESHLNFGGGEKDIFLAVPLLLWSLVFMVGYFVLWWRGASFARSVAVAAGVATGGIVFAWLVLFGVAWYRYG